MVFYADDPDGPGGLVYAGASALLLLVAAAGPLVHQVPPRHVWVFASLGAFLFACTSLEWVLTYEVGPFELSDMFLFGGYTCLIVLFVLLTRLSSPRRDDSYLPDALAGTAGVALALWSSVLAPLSTTDLPSGVVWAAYPPLDATVLALATHLALRLGRVTAPLGWFLLSLLSGLTMDTISTVWEVLGAGDTNLVLDLGFLLGHFTLACALCHPALGDHWVRPQEGAAGRHPERSAAFAVLTLSPAVLAITIPVVGRVDALVRAVLVVVILALLFVRMHRTLQDLSRAEEDSHHRATHDQLTGLLNRPALLEVLRRRLELDARRGRRTVVLFLDCDDFKTVNDTWGHVAGDTLLEDVAARFRTRLGPGEIAARLGGDEFVVVGSVVRPEQARDLAERVRALFDEPLRILPGRVRAMTPSIGVASTEPGESVTTDDLLGRADVAMYEAKQRGKGRVVVAGENDDGHPNGSDTNEGDTNEGDTAVERRLVAALAVGAIEVDLQAVRGGPGYGEVVARRAVPRWRDPDSGELGAETLTALAARRGLGDRVGELVLRRACAQVGSATGSMSASACDGGALPGVPALHVAVTASQVRSAGFVDLVREVLGTPGLPPGCLHLDVPETLLLEPAAAAREVLTAAHEAGARLCVDGFGAGHASLWSLVSLPVDAVTLDRRLLAGVEDDETVARRVSAVLVLLRGLGLDHVVATGVETAAQEEALRRLGCPMVTAARAPGSRRPSSSCRDGTPRRAARRRPPRPQ